MGGRVVHVALSTIYISITNLIGGIVSTSQQRVTVQRRVHRGDGCQRTLHPLGIAVAGKLKQQCYSRTNSRAGIIYDRQQKYA